MKTQSQKADVERLTEGQNTPAATSNVAIIHDAADADLVLLPMPMSGLLPMPSRSPCSCRCRYLFSCYNRSPSDATDAVAFVVSLPPAYAVAIAPAVIFVFQPESSAAKLIFSDPQGWSYVHLAEISCRDRPLNQPFKRTRFAPTLNQQLKRRSEARQIFKISHYTFKYSIQPFHSPFHPPAENNDLFIHLRQGNQLELQEDNRDFSRDQLKPQF